MREGYSEFFQKVSDIYDSAGGYSTLIDAINSGKLKDGLGEKQYGIALVVLHGFFEDKNGLGSNRVFGIEHEIKGLIKKCEEIESNTALQSI